MTDINKSNQTQARRGRQSLAWRLSMLIGGVCLALLAPPVMAACTGNNQGAGSVTFSPPAVIQLPANLSVGTTIWTSPQAIPGNPVTLNYCGNNTSTGLENAKWGPPIGADQTLFPTNYPWLSYRILHPDDATLLQAWPNYPVSATGGTIFNVASSLAFVITGTIPPGTHVLGGGQLTQWDVDTGNGNKQTVEIFNITTSTITLVPPTCAILIDPTVVTLPAIAPTALPNNGSTAGQTPFNIRLNCQAYNHNLQITLATAVHTGNNNQGVISPTTTGAGVATNVGIQLLQGPICTTPVTWNQAISEGHPINGEMDLPFCAQYYRTQTTKKMGQYPVTSGNVTGTATYTLNYQ